MELRVASTPASIGGPVSRAPGLPVTPLLRCRLMTAPPGCPEGSIFRPDRRWIIELPRLSHPLAAPSARLQVAPPPCFSSASDGPLGCPGDASSGLPTVTLRVAPHHDLPAWLYGLRLRASPLPHPLGLPRDRSSSFPELRILWPRRTTWSPGFPKFPDLPAAPHPLARVAPSYASAAVPPGVFGFPRILPLRLGRC